MSGKRNATIGALASKVIIELDPVDSNHGSMVNITDETSPEDEERRRMVFTADFVNFLLANRV